MVFGGVLAAHAIHQFLLGVVELIIGAGPRDVVLVHSLQPLPPPEGTPSFRLPV